MTALAEYGGFEIAMLVGAIGRAGSAGLCVVVDGVIVTAAALLAVGAVAGVPGRLRLRASLGGAGA